MNRELQELSALISKCTLSEEAGMKPAAAKIVQLMMKDVDLCPLAGNITKLLASPDIIVKRIVCAFISRYSNKVTNLNLLATNTLLKDLKDPNPLIRGLAVKTIFQVPHLVEQEETILFGALEDNNPYVRRIAIMCCCQYLNSSHTDNASKPEFVNCLYKMIRDPDVGVVTNCLLALDEILASEGGIVVNYNIASYLLSRISTFHEWGISVILNTLKKYIPQKEEELFEILNCLDEYLTHNSSVIVIGTIRIFLHLTTTNFPHIMKEALECVFPHIRSYLMRSNNELVYAVLDLTREFTVYNKDIFCTNYKLFFCRFSDSTVVKIKKLSILPLLANEANIVDISDELITYCTNNTFSIYKTAVGSIVELTNLFPGHSLKTLTTLITLMDLQCESLTVEILTAFISIDLQDHVKIKSELISAISRYYKQINTASGKCAILSLLGECGHIVPDTPYILESMIDAVGEKEEAVVKHALITAAVKIFLHRPAEMQEILGFWLEKCQDDKNPWICDQAQFYYSLLHNVSLSKNIILGEDIKKE